MKIVKNFKSPHKYIDHIGARWMIDVSTSSTHLHREDGPAEINQNFVDDLFKNGNRWWLDGACFFRVAREKEIKITVYI